MNGFGTVARENAAVASHALQLMDRPLATFIEVVSLSGLTLEDWFDLWRRWVQLALKLAFDLR